MNTEAKCEGPQYQDLRWRHSQSAEDRTRAVCRRSISDRLRDDYPTRLTILNEYQEEWWPLYSIKKAVLELDSLGDLDHSHDLCEGDMAKVRMRIDPKRIGEWPQDKAEIRDWAARHGIKLAAIEAPR